MKATYRWIKEYVPDYGGSVQEMCDAFTMSGTEVEFYRALDDDDWMIEFTVTSNRVDCNGVIGLARELSAVTGHPLVLPSVELSEGRAPVEAAGSVEVLDPTRCSRFTARVLEGVEVGPSPGWLKSRIESIGLRSVNNVVDATNFAMFETNQPFHAFDLRALPEGKIIVRKARAGETLVAINARSYDLQPEDLAICDRDRVVGIAGVMGGQDTEVSDATTDILLETACFEPLGVRATARRLALHSDASYRFERGVDAAWTEWASRRCAALILEVAGGTLRRGVIDIAAPSPARAPIGFRHEQVSRITGIEISWERCAEIFRGLGFEVAGDPGSSITVLPPSWRVDLDREIDLIEEVIRVHGLHHIPVETDMRVALVTDRHPARVRTIVKDTLVACGFLETLTTSFLPEKAARISFFSETEPVTISNAMRKEEDALRQSLLPSLLAVRKTNQDRYNDDVRVAECTVVYLARPGLEIPEHLPIVGGLLDGDLREARGVVERLLNGLGIENPVFTALDDHAAAILDEGARVALSDGTTLGYVGRPQAALCESNDLRVTPRYFELRLDVLGAHADLQPAFRPLSKFPPVKRDLAVVVDEGLSWGEIETLIRSLELPDLEELVVFDEYRGKQVGDGKKSLAFSLNYRSFERTLTGEEVDQAQARVISALSDRFQAVVRS